MSTAAVITNSALIVFTGDLFNNTKDFERVWYFVLFEHCLFMIKYALAIVVPDVPFEVEIQLARQSFLRSKVHRCCCYSVHHYVLLLRDRQSVVSGKCVSVREDCGGCRIFNKRR